jgi:hypothetical protein
MFQTKARFPPGLFACRGERRPLSEHRTHLLAASSSRSALLRTGHGWIGISQHSRPAATVHIGLQFCTSTGDGWACPATAIAPAGSPGRFGQPLGLVFALGFRTSFWASDRTSRVIGDYLVKRSNFTERGTLFEDILGDDFRVVRTAAYGELERRTIADFPPSGALKAIRGDAAALSHALGNTLSTSNTPFATYVAGKSDNCSGRYESSPNGAHQAQMEDKGRRKAGIRRATPNLTLCKHGGSDGTRTRDLRRDRPAL